MRAILTVIGKDRIGIIHGVSSVLAETSVNILDISQTIMDDMFVMIMLVDCQLSTVPFQDLSSRLDKIGDELGVQIKIQHEEIFQSMHRI